MQLKQKVFLSLFYGYWVLVGGQLISLIGWGAMMLPPLVAIHIVLCCLVLFFARNKFLHILSALGLYAASLIILFVSVSFAIVFLEPNKIAYSLAFLVFGLLQFPIAYWTIKLTQIKNKI